MPEIPVNKHRKTPLSKHNIRSTRQIPGMSFKSQAP